MDENTYQRRLQDLVDYAPPQVVHVATREHLVAACAQAGVRDAQLAGNAEVLDGKTLWRVEGVTHEEWKQTAARFVLRQKQASAQRPLVRVTGEAGKPGYAETVRFGLYLRRVDHACSGEGLLRTLSNAVMLSLVESRSVDAAKRATYSADKAIVVGGEADLRTWLLDAGRVSYRDADSGAWERTALVPGSLELSVARGAWPSEESPMAVDLVTYEPGLPLKQALHRAHQFRMSNKMMAWPQAQVQAYEQQDAACVVDVVAGFTSRFSSDEQGVLRFRVYLVPAPPEQRTGAYVSMGGSPAKAKPESKAQQSTCKRWVLGRERRLTKVGRCWTLRFRNEVITLSQARALERRR